MNESYIELLDGGDGALVLGRGKEVIDMVRLRGLWKGINS